MLMLESGYLRLKQRKLSYFLSVHFIRIWCNLNKLNFYENILFLSEIIRGIKNVEGHYINSRSFI